MNWIKCSDQMPEITGQILVRCEKYDTTNNYMYVLYNACGSKWLKKDEYNTNEEGKVFLRQIFVDNSEFTDEKWVFEYKGDKFGFRDFHWIRLPFDIV